MLCPGSGGGSESHDELPCLVLRAVEGWGDGLLLYAMEALCSSVRPSDGKDTGHGLRILDFLPGSLVPWVTLRGGEGKGDEEAQVACSRSTWTIPAVQGGRHGRGQDPQVPQARKLSVTQASGPRERP